MALVHIWRTPSPVMCFVRCRSPRMQASWGQAVCSTYGWMDPGTPPRARHRRCWVCIWGWLSQAHLLAFLVKFHTAYYEMMFMKRDLLDRGLETISYNEQKGQGWYCGLNCVSSNLYEALTPSTSEGQHLETGPLREVIKLKWSLTVGPHPIRLLYL